MAHEAALAAHEAAQLVDQANRATHLHATLGDKPPPSISEDDALVRQVAEALATWRMQPEEQAPSSPTSAEIRERLSTWQQASSGNKRPVSSARVALAAASVAAVAGVALLATASRTGGIALLVAAVALVVLGISRLRAGPGVDAAQQNAQRDILQAQLETTRAGRAARGAGPTETARCGATSDRCAGRMWNHCPHSPSRCRCTRTLADQPHDKCGQLGTAQRQWAELQALLAGIPCSSYATMLPGSSPRP